MSKKESLSALFFVAQVLFTFLRKIKFRCISDRDGIPKRVTVVQSDKYTFGYNAPSLKEENLTVKRVVADNYDFGVTEIKSPSGNPLRVYNLERTLCDIMRGSGIDIQTAGEAMKRYAASKNKDIHCLLQYAEQLRVKPKILRYLEVLL